MKYILKINDVNTLEIANVVEQINAIPADGTTARCQLNITLPSNTIETMSSVNELFNSITVSKLDVFRIEDDTTQNIIFSSTVYGQPNVIRKRFTAENPSIEIVFFKP